MESGRLALHDGIRRLARLAKLKAYTYNCSLARFRWLVWHAGAQSQCPDGEIGRHKGLKSLSTWFRKVQCESRQSRRTPCASFSMRETMPSQASQEEGVESGRRGPTAAMPWPRRIPDPKPGDRAAKAVAGKKIPRLRLCRFNSGSGHHHCVADQIFMCARA
jgi:hypothetical protein